jgi:hypothetical protein
MQASKDTAIAVLRIALEDIGPLISRRVAAPTSLRLKDIHGVIQAVMGWDDCHLWEFVAQGRKYGLRIPNDPDWNQRISNAVTTKLSSFVADGVKDMSYVYDMGDNWQHRMIVEKLIPAEPDTRYPQFLGGERRCPPEDCGGVPGYYEFLSNISGKQTNIRSARRRSTGMVPLTIRMTSTRTGLSPAFDTLPGVAMWIGQEPSEPEHRVSPPAGGSPSRRHLRGPNCCTLDCRPCRRILYTPCSSLPGCWVFTATNAAIGRYLGPPSSRSCKTI